MDETLIAAVDQPTANDLISFLKAIPDGRYRRGVRYPQWFLLLVAVLGILSGCRSSRDLEAFARRQREALNPGPIRSHAELIARAAAFQPSSSSKPLMSWARAASPSAIDQKPSRRKAFMARLRSVARIRTPLGSR